MSWSEDEQLQKLEFGSDGFRFTGTPCNTEKYWEHLADQQTEAEMEHKRALRMPVMAHNERSGYAFTHAAVFFLCWVMAKVKSAKNARFNPEILFVISCS